MKKRWIYKFRSFSLSKKMTVVFFAILSVVGVVSFTAIQAVLNVYDGKLYRESQQELTYFTYMLEERLEDLEKASYDIAMDFDIQQQLVQMRQEENPAEYLKSMDRLRNKMMNVTVAEKSVINLIYTDGESLNLKAGKEYTQIPDEMFEEILQKASEASGGFVYLQPSPNFPYLVSGREIRRYSDYSLKSLGMLVIFSDFHAFIEECYSDLGSPSSELCIRTEKGKVYVSDPDCFSEELELEGSQGYRVLNRKDQKFFMCYQKSERTGWTLIHMTPYSDIFRTNTRVRYTLLFQILALFFVAGIAVRKFSHVLTEPLERLIDSTEKVQQGKFASARESLEGEVTQDEIGRLQESFRIMLERIEILIHENYEKQIVLKDTQYQALQAQINPHFLYNTLNSIAWMIKVGRGDEASDMVMALGHLFREAFSKEPMETVKEELSLIEDYISIQKARYGKRARFAINCQKEVEECRIPKLSLQPIVENAILYGVENSAQPCEIVIDVREKNGQLCMEVSDTGPGIDPEELKQMRSFQMKPKGNGIGLKNIRERMKLIFGEDCSFEIESEKGRGTVMRIIVPIQKGDVYVPNGNRG